MPKTSVSARGGALPAASPRTPETAFIDPASLPDVYGLVLKGTCMEPDMKDGSTMGFTKVEKPKVGDLVVIWFGPGRTPPGEPQCSLKRLVLDAMPGTTYPHRDHPESEVIPIIIVANPPRQYSVRCSSILALHKCTGPLAPEQIAPKPKLKRSV